MTDPRLRRGKDLTVALSSLLQTRRSSVLMEAHNIWYENEVMWTQKSQKIKPQPTSTTRSERYLLHCYCRTRAQLHIHLLDGLIYRVVEQTDVLTDQDVWKHWEAFGASDRAELRQFIEQKVFSRVKLNDMDKDTIFVDATWVRKFKRADGELKPKSRLCARGFLDPQKTELPTRSTTATRLSQRLILACAATHNLELASWDISGASSRGSPSRRSDRHRQTVLRRGITSPSRKVVIIPPANVWKHLESFDPSCRVEEAELGHVGLLCNKPAYGLVVAPLSWQLCLHETLRETGGTQSLLDENLWFWKDAQGHLQGTLTTHVDDLAIAGASDFMVQKHKFLPQKFGKITVQNLPSVHCGCRYSKLPDGFKLDQQEFVDAMKVYDLKDTKNPDRQLTPEETSQLRSIHDCCVSQLRGWTWWLTLVCSSHE